MAEQFLCEVLVVGPTKDDIVPPNELARFPTQIDTPFDVDDEQSIKQWLRTEFGPGYFRVFAPGHAQRCKTYFKGPVADR
jgi:hypothetical protein